MKKVELNTEARRTRRDPSLIHGELTEQVIGAAIEVHKNLGPGLLESVYGECLCHEFGLRGLPFLRQVYLPVDYKGIEIECNFKMDFLIADAVVVEIKAVEALLPVRVAQLWTYLRLSKKKVGLLINFNVDVLKDGIVRRVM